MLLDRCKSIVSEQEDREKEVKHITKALESCGYLNWTIKKMKEQQSQKRKTKERTDKNAGKSIQRYGHSALRQMSNRNPTAVFKI